MTEVFLDTSYAIALVNERDQYYKKAWELADYWERSNIQVVTTRAVVLEIGNALAKSHRNAAILLLDDLDDDPTIEVIPLSETLYRRGFELFRRRQDKAWGLVDCISFVVMQDRGITDAFTSDHHFRQAGFAPLLSDR